MGRHRAEPAAEGGPRVDSTDEVYKKRWAALIAVVGGMLGVFALPPFGIWPLMFGSVAALSYAVDRRSARTAAWLGYLYGFVFNALLLHWTSTYVGAVPWMALVIAEAGYFAGLAVILTRLQTLPFAPLWIASAWVLQEAFRGRWPWGGFPWGRLAFSQAESPVRWFAALGGAPLVTFVVALAGAALWQARMQRVALAGAVLVPVLGLVLAVPLKPDNDAPTAIVAAVQGNVPKRGLQMSDRARQVLENHVAETLRLAERINSGQVPQPSLVLWPENASDIDPYLDDSAATLITQASQAVNAPIFVGAILDGPGPADSRNAGILWSPYSGAGAMYVKRHPVPFAEYLPLRSIAEAISPEAKLIGHMVAGGGNGLITGGPYPFGDVICFEVAYDGLVRSSVKAGAQLLVIQTNNATFGNSGETYQQLAMSQLRAVEHGRSTVQVSTTGETAMIGPDGKIIARTGALFTNETLVTALPLRRTSTLATRIGALPEWLFVGLAFGATAWSIARSRRTSRSSEPAMPLREESLTA